MFGSRRRLWDEADSSDKRACQHTLHEVLLTVCQLMAPVAPFMPDKIHRDLTGCPYISRIGLLVRN